MSDLQLEKEQVSYLYNVISWAKVYANITEDLSRSILGFIPKGLNGSYDHVLKNLPLIGNLFSRRWIEQGIKLFSGITIGQGLAADIAHFIFWPLGFALGILVASIASSKDKNIPIYHGQIGKGITRFSAQT